MENTDFVIEHIDEEVQVIADQPSVVTNYPANTDFFIENIDSNVISIAHSLNIEASEVNFRPANTDFFIENIDKNVIAIAESMNLSPSEVDFRPANTDFFVENIDKNLIKIAESLSLTPYEVTIRPANTDMFIENIDKNVTLIKGSTNVVTVSGEYININLPDGGKVQSAQLNGNATQDGTPTPDAPVPISVVTGENVVKVVGKNLFDVAPQTTTSNGLTSTVNADGTITISGTLTSSWANILTSVNLALPAGTYTFSDGLTDAERPAWITITPTMSDGSTGATLSLRTQGATSFPTRTYTQAITKIRMVVEGSSSGTTINLTLKPQLELGNSASSFEPYQGQDYEVNLGKNLIKFAGDSGTASFGSGVSATVLSNGTIKLNGTATSNGWLELIDPNHFLGGVAVSNTILFPLDTTQTYSVSCKLVSGSFSASNASFNLIYTDTDTNKVVSLDSSATITGGNGVCRGYIRVNNGNTFDNAVFSVQLELGSQATSYAEYFTPIELCKVGTYQDRIYKDGKKWYVEKQVGKATYNGSETWNYVSSDNGYFQFNTPSMNVVPFDGNPATNALCDHFIPRSRWYVATGKVNGTINLNGSYCAIRYETYPPTAQGLADFKSWLSTHPTTVYYALATPTTTEITNQALIDQLEALASASLGYGVNNIWIEIATGNAMPTLELVIEKY